MTLYFPTVNFLRGLAALMVCFYHFTNHSDHHGMLLENGHWLQKAGEFGVHGVFMFFVISGFVIPLSLYKSKFELKRTRFFLMKRFIRIEIPYFASIVLSLLITLSFSVKNNTPFEVEIGRLLSHLFYITPFTEYEWYNPIYWTLAIEFQFYLIIGLIYLGLKGKQSRFQSLILIVIALSSLLIEDKRLLFHYMPLFCLGMNLYLLKTNQCNQLSGLINLIMITVVLYFTQELNLVLFSLLAYGIIDRISINSRLTNMLGDVSYSLYLTHGLIGGSTLYLLSRYAHSELEKIGLLLLALTISTVFSFIFWKWIEKPSKELSKRN